MPTSDLSFCRTREFIVVLDDSERENERDLIIAALDITAEQMAFMIRHTSGLICVPALPVPCATLEVSQMVVNSEDPKGTAYTLPIDANHPNTMTGISAQERALTCRALGKKNVKKEDFRRPGYIFPLEARKGGVRESALDILRRQSSSACWRACNR